LIPKDEKEALALIDETLEQLEENRARPLLRRLAEAWANGNLAEIESYEDWCDCVHDDDEREFLRRVNDERNPHLASGIDALHLSGKRVFAAVGALHMVGAKSLPKLLAARGYAVERMSF
ncbi:MAG: TraB/GumN family protein, partial [Candidatus Binatia bacterium]